MVGPSNWVGAFLEFAQRVTLRGFHRGFLFGGFLRGRGVFLQSFLPNCSFHSPVKILKFHPCQILNGYGDMPSLTIRESPELGEPKNRGSPRFGEPKIRGAYD